MALLGPVDKYGQKFLPHALSTRLLLGYMNFDFNFGFLPSTFVIELLFFLSHQSSHLARIRRVILMLLKTKFIVCFDIYRNSYCNCIIYISIWVVARNEQKLWRSKLITDSTEHICIDWTFHSSGIKLKSKLITVFIVVVYVNQACSLLAATI